MLKEYHNGGIAEGFDAINFEVIETPLYYKSVVDSTELVMSDQKVILKGDTGDLLGIHSNNYKLLPNKEVIEKLNPFIDQGYELNKLSNLDNKKFRFELVKPDIEYNVSNHIVHPRIIVENSYDGSLSFKAMAGYFVQICSNGAIAGNRFYNIQAKHYGNFMADFAKFDGNQVAKALSNFERKNWENRLDPDKYLQLQTALCKGIPDRKEGPSYFKIQLENRYHRERETIQVDEFALFMAATYLSTHGLKVGATPTQMRLAEKNVSEVFVNEIF